MEGRSISVRANGLRFAVTEYGEGERFALCLHGFPQTSRAFAEVAIRLARRGYRVWAPDLRGYGETERPTGQSAYAIEALMDDVAGLIEASGAPRATVIAHDWGGLIAWHLVMRRPELFDRFVPINMPHPLMMRRAMIDGPQLAKSYYVLLFQLPWLPERLLRLDDLRFLDNAFRGMSVTPEVFDDATLAHYRAAASAPGALSAMLAYYRAYVRGGGALRELRRGLPTIDVPTLMIWGEHDTALGRETTLGTETIVSDFTLRYLPDASHWVPEEVPDDVDALIGAWVSGEPVPEAWEL